MSVLYVEMARQTRPKAQGQYWLSSFLIFYTYIYIYTFCLKSRSLFIHMKDNITTKLKDQMLRQKKRVFYSIYYLTRAVVPQTLFLISLKTDGSIIFDCGV